MSLKNSLRILLVSAGTSAGVLGHAQTSDFGMGFVIGEPTGLSIKAKLSGSNYLQAALAWNLQHHSVFQVNVDYLHHNYNVFHVNKGQLPLYYGIGGRMRFWDGNEYWRDGRWYDRDGKADIAVRIPVGLDYEFAAAPFDIFLEVVPTLGVLPTTYFDINAGLGARYWF